MTGLKDREIDAAAGSTTFVVDTGRFLWLIFLSCLIVEVAFVYLDLTINWWRWSESGAVRRLFNITREDGLASWFAASQTLLVALVAWLLFAVACRRDVERTRRIAWLTIALFLSYMCIDDGAAVHERIGTTFRESAESGGYPSYAWQFLLLPFFALAGAFVLYYLWAEMPRTVDRIKVSSAIGCFVLAVGMDFVEGMDEGYTPLLDASGWKLDAIRHFAKSIEESVEMVGMSIFLVTFLGHLSLLAPSLKIRFIASDRDNVRC